MGLMITQANGKRSIESKRAFLLGEPPEGDQEDDENGDESDKSGDGNSPDK